MPNTDPSNWTDSQRREKCAEIVGNAGWRFRCPRCGSSHFGTSHLHEPHDQWVRHCHDEFGRGCHWSGADSECCDFDPDRSYDDAFALLKRVCEKHGLHYRLTGWSVDESCGCDLLDTNQTAVASCGCQSDLRRAIVTACLRVEQQKEAATT